MTRLVLSPYSAGGAPADYRHRLHGVERNLVRENLALLIGDGLTIERERVLRVVTEAVKQAIGIGRNSRRGQGHQRAKLGRRALQGNFVEQSTVNVSMESRIVLHQVAGFALHRNILGGGRNLEGHLQVHRNRRANVDVLHVRSEAGKVNRQVIRIQGHIGEAESSRSVGLCGSSELADRILNLDGRPGNYRAGRVGYDAAER